MLVRRCVYHVLRLDTGGRRSQSTRFFFLSFLSPAWVKLFNMTPYEQLKNICQSAERPLKLLVVCPDLTRRQRAYEFVMHSFGSDSARNSIVRLEGTALNADAVSRLKDSSQNLSLFSSETTYIFKDLQAVSAALASELNEIISNPKTSNNYIAFVPELPAKSWLNKAFKKNETVIFEGLEAAALLKWTTAELNRAGLGKTSQKVAEKIIVLGSENADLIAALIEKLALLTDSEALELADLKHFELFVEKTREFEFINLLALGRKTEALSCLKAFETSSTSAFPLMSLASKMVFNYFGLKLGQVQKMTSDELMKALSLSPWAMKKQQETSQKADISKLLRSVQALARADSQLKNKNLGEQQILIELVANV